MPTNRRRRHVMAYVTAPNRATAKKIARAVLDARLAACANLVPIESMYWWHGRLEDAREVLVVFKTRRALAGKLAAAVRRHHPYEVPCVVTYAVDDGLPDYLAWIDAETARQR